MFMDVLFFIAILALFFLFVYDYRRRVQRQRAALAARARLNRSLAAAAAIRAAADHENSTPSPEELAERRKKLDQAVTSGVVLKDAEGDVVGDFGGEDDERVTIEEACAICLLDYENEEAICKSKQCSHVFHNKCIMNWLEQGSNECPCCRRSFVGDEETGTATPSTAASSATQDVDAVVVEVEA